MKLYEALNVDRNECLTMINLAQQRKLELQEKSRLYENELSILKSALENKHIQLDELAKQLEELQKSKISLRADLSREVGRLSRPYQNR